MPISKDLFLAILAMDSYNRGYDPAFADPDTDGTEGLGGLGSQVGTARFIEESDPILSQAINFYASAYTVENGPEGLNGTVISYRGTDDPDPANAAGDFRTGWFFGTGVTEGTQLSIARDFYEQVTGPNPFDAQTAIGPQTPDPSPCSKWLGMRPA